MGASCSQEEGPCSSCTSGNCGATRPTFDGVPEYKPQDRTDGLKESDEQSFPSAAALGRAAGVDPEHAAATAHRVEGVVGHAAAQAAGFVLGAAHAVADTLASSPESEPTLDWLEAGPGAREDRPGNGGARDTVAGGEQGAVKGRGFGGFGAPVQVSAWSRVGGATAGAQAEVMEMGDWVHENHITLRFLCLCIALALLVSSVLGCFNIFDAVFHPFQYLFACYNVFFAWMIVVLDGRSTMTFNCVNSRRRLFEALWCLTHTRGRACLYFYVGSINLIMLPESGILKIVYQVIGGALCAAGLLILSHGCACCRNFERSQGVDLGGFSIQNAAQSGIDAVHDASINAKLQFMRIKSYVHSNTVTLKIVCTFIACAMFCISVLSVITLFGLFFNPYQYLIASYNLVFSFIIVLIDGPRDWLDRCWGIRKKVFQAAPCLGWLTGRAFFFVYVGSLNMVVMPANMLWRSIYWALGGALCFAGVLMLLHRFVCRGKQLDDIVGTMEDG